MYLKAKQILIVTILVLSGCQEKTVIIQPGAFTEEWPTVLRGELIKNKHCIVDQVNGVRAAKLTIKQGEKIDLSGWAFTDQDGTPPYVYVQLVGPALTYTSLAQTRPPRPDVNQIHQLDSSWNAGFTLQATQNIEPNEYNIEILQPGDHGVAQCKTPIILKIAPM